MTEDSRDHHRHRNRRSEPRPHHSPSAPAGERPRPGGASPAAGAGDWLLIGDVVGVFGIAGELKVRPETDFPERFAATPTVYLGAERTPFRVAGARLAQPHVILRLDGVADANAAERLRGAPVYVPTSQATALPPDRFYLHDVVGLRAERPDGTPLGTVAEVYTGLANDVFVVRATGSGREVLVPAVKEMVVRVDLAAGVVVLDPIPGLFDDDFETAG